MAAAQRLDWAPPTLPASPPQPPAAGRCTPTWPPSSAPPTFKLARRTALPSSSTTSGCSLPVRGRWPSSPPAGARRQLDACACTPAHVSRPASTQLFSSPGAAIGMIPVQLRATAGWLVSPFSTNDRPPLPSVAPPAAKCVTDGNANTNNYYMPGRVLLQLLTTVPPPDGDAGKTTYVMTTSVSTAQCSAPSSSMRVPCAIGMPWAWGVLVGGLCVGWDDGAFTCRSATHSRHLNHPACNVCNALARHLRAGPVLALHLPRGPGHERCSHQAGGEGHWHRLYRQAGGHWHGGLAREQQEGGGGRGGCWAAALAAFPWPVAVPVPAFLAVVCLLPVAPALEGRGRRCSNSSSSLAALRLLPRHGPPASSCHFPLLCRRRAWLTACPWALPALVSPSGTLATCGPTTPWPTATRSGGWNWVWAWKWSWVGLAPAGRLPAGAGAPTPLCVRVQVCKKIHASWHALQSLQPCCCMKICARQLIAAILPPPPCSVGAVAYVKSGATASAIRAGNVPTRNTMCAGDWGGPLLKWSPSVQAHQIVSVG